MKEERKESEELKKKILWTEIGRESRSFFSSIHNGISSVQTMHYFPVEQIGRDRTMPTTPMALLSALDRNGLRNPDYFRSSTYLFTSNLPPVSTSTSKWYRPTIPRRTFQDWRNNAWLIASSLPILLLPYATFLPISRRSPVNPFFPRIISGHLSREEDSRIIIQKSYNNFYLPLNIETHIRFQFRFQIFPTIHVQQLCIIYTYLFHTCFLLPSNFSFFVGYRFRKKRLIAYTRQLGGLENFHERMVRARTIGGVLSRSPVVSQSVTWWQPCKQPWRS